MTDCEYSNKHGSECELGSSTWDFLGERSTADEGVKKEKSESCPLDQESFVSASDQLLSVGLAAPVTRSRICGKDLGGLEKHLQINISDGN